VKIRKRKPCANSPPVRSRSISTGGTSDRPERTGAKRHLAVQTTAEALLANLKRNGTEYIFVNAGTDFASIVEAYARLDESGLDFPTPIVATHENLAVGMAHGYYLIKHARKR